MRIAFSKVGRSPGEFRFSHEETTISGTLLKRAHHEVRLDGQIEGEVPLYCDRCGAAFTETVSFPLELTLTDRPEKISDNLDTIEFLDGEIDIAALLESEVASYRSSYHYCPKCREEDREIDIEY
jgi:uncharacterized metal-binding protein YceD (DUF177 family)